MIRFGAKKNAAGQHVTVDATTDDDARGSPKRKKCVDDGKTESHKKKRAAIAAAASFNEKSDEEVAAKTESTGESNRTLSFHSNTGDTSDAKKDDCSNFSSTDKGRKRVDETSSTFRHRYYHIEKCGKKSKRGESKMVDSRSTSGSRQARLNGQMFEGTNVSGNHDDGDDNDKKNTKYEKGTSYSLSSSSVSSQEMIQIPLKKRIFKSE